MGKMQRTKGATYEREIVHTISSALGVELKRNLDQVRDGGGDILLDHYVIECKRRASLSLYAWLDQATESCVPNQIPIVAARGDQRESVVIMRLNDFLEVLKASRQQKDEPPANQEGS